MHFLFPVYGSSLDDNGRRERWTIERIPTPNPFSSPVLVDRSPFHKTFDSTERTTDNRHEQKTHCGIAFADIVVAVPATFMGIALIFVNLARGVYVLSMISFWFVWANTMTTATSLRFEKPKMTVTWFVTFPLGILIGLAYLTWAVANFNTVFQVENHARARSQVEFSHSICPDCMKELYPEISSNSD